MKEIKYCSKRRTHEKIKATFATLLAEKKALNKITVAELAERAEITRGTFYSHYNNIFEVAEELENDFISVLDLPAEKLVDPAEFSSYFQQVFSFLAEHEELYRQLLSSDAPMVFIARLNHQIEKTLKEVLNSHAVDRPMLDLDIAFFTDGATYMILKYFRDEISLSLDEIEWYLKQRIEEMFLKDL